MAKITQPNLPADLPENWNNSQYVSADGAVAGLTPKHGYNYLMQQVNNAQKAVNTLAQQAQTDLTSMEKQVGDLEQSVGGLEKGGFNATAQRTGTTVAITGPDGASTVTFLAPSNWVAGDTYTYNGQTLTLTDLNGQPVKNGWKQGAPVTLSISGSAAYFAAGASGDFLPLEGGTMTGPAVGAPGAIATPQFRNVQYGTEALTPGVSPLPQGMLYITPEAEAGESGGKRTCRFVVGTSTAGWTEADCDYLCDGTADDVEINAAIQALPATGGEIVILDGLYNITATISVGKPNVTLSGSGAGTILKRMWNTNGVGPVVSFDKGASPSIARDFQIDGNKNEFSSKDNDGLMAANGKFIINSLISNNNAGIGIYVYAENTSLIGCTCFNNGKDGAYIGASAGTQMIRSCLLSGNARHGIYASGQVIAIGNICIENLEYGIYCSYGVFVGNVANQNTKGGIKAQGGGINGKISVVGNKCIENGTGISIEGAQSTVCGNVCHDNETAIFVSGEQNLISANVALRSLGIPGNYNSAQNTIVSTTSSRDNLFVGNSIMGKNYVDSGTNNTWANNKYQ